MNGNHRNHVKVMNDSFDNSEGASHGASAPPAAQRGPQNTYFIFDSEQSETDMR